MLHGMETFQTKVLEKKHILCSITFSRKSCRLWYNVKKYCRAGLYTGVNIIRSMRFTCWIAKATNTLRICNAYSFPIATMVTRTRLNVTLYVQCLSCFILYYSVHLIASLSMVAFTKCPVNEGFLCDKVFVLMDTIKGTSYISEVLSHIS